MFDDDNGRSSSRNDFPRLTKGNQFGIALFYILQVVAFSLAAVNLVLTAVDFDYGDDANDAVRTLEDELRDAGIIDNGCMTCNRETGELTFNSTLDIVFNKIYHYANFHDGNLEDAGILRGIAFPGYAFANSPLSGDGTPTFLGDAVVAVESGIDQSSYGLLTAVPPDGYTLNQKPPNPTGFRIDSSTTGATQKKRALALGVFRQSSASSSARCDASGMAPSPSVYFVIKDSVSPATRHLCICVSNNAEFGPGAGEHCTTATFGTSVF